MRPPIDTAQGDVARGPLHSWPVIYAGVDLHDVAAPYRAQYSARISKCARWTDLQHARRRKVLHRGGACYGHIYAAREARATILGKRNGVVTAWQTGKFVSERARTSVLHYRCGRDGCARRCIETRERVHQIGALRVAIQQTAIHCAIDAGSGPSS